MKYVKEIEKYKNVIVEELYNWAITFYYGHNIDGEEVDEGYDMVYSLAMRLENNKCTKEDYENILFHIWQINYNETRIPIDYHFNG